LKIFLARFLTRKKMNEKKEKKLKLKLKYSVKTRGSRVRFL
jgi:hypothetical protein